MLDNAPALLKILKQAGVNWYLRVTYTFRMWPTMRGLRYHNGSLVSYPHPYRIFEFRTDEQGQQWLQIESHRVTSVPGWENLPQKSRELMGDRSHPFMLKLLTAEPLNLPLADAEKLVPSLRYFWANIAAGDSLFDFPEFFPEARRYFEAFSAISSDGEPALIDNHTTLLLK
jgi:hypothetical protein